MIYFWAITAIVFFILLSINGVRYYRINKLYRGKQQELEKKAKKIKISLESEIKRQQYIIEKYKEQLKLKKSEDKNQKISKQTENQQQAIPEHEVKDVVAEKVQLEREREKFKEKNKKLWEQSIAIHKEKERIDILRKRIEAKHKEITDSINYAQRIQTALLPPNTYMNEILKNYFILYKPRNIVSGDFYWAKQTGNRIFVVAADCTGHGVPGAFVSMLGISFLNEILAVNKSIKANEVLEKMRDMVKISLRQTNKRNSIPDGMDMVLCIIDTETDTLEFSGANNGIFMLREGEITEYKGVRNPIAVYRKEKPFLNHTIKLKKGDKIFLFSDGFVDQFGGDRGRKIRKRTFIEIIQQCSSENIPISQYDIHLNKFLEEWMGDKYEQIDDILVIGIEY